MKKYILVLITIIVLVLIGFNRTARIKTSSSDKLHISTSFYPLYYLTKQIVGDRADVANITPSGAEPHDYEPMPQDIITIGDSQILIMNGQLEPWGSKIKEDLRIKNVRVLEVSNNLITRNIQNEEGELAPDPHVWLSPKLAAAMAKTITENLVDLDPSDASAFRSNNEHLQAVLVDLDQSYRDGLSQCKTKNIITSHAAFGYLASDYGLNQVSLAGLSPEAEPSLQELTQIAQFAKENDVEYIFFESLVSPKLAETIATEVGAKTLVLNPLEGLSNDEERDGHDYVSVMKDNLNNLRTALKCQ